MQFVVRMVGRELRSSWRRLVFFFICVAIGVGTIVALRSLVQNVRDALTAEARVLIAADVYLRVDQPWTTEVLSAVETRLASSPGILQTETLDVVTMVRVPDELEFRTKVVELRGVGESFPFYGTLQLMSGRRYVHEVLSNNGALVAPDLLAQMNLDVGGVVLIGNTEFTIRDVIKVEPGRQLGAFGFGPRVIVAYEALLEIGLLGVGSRSERQILLRLPEEVEIGPFVDGLRKDLSEEFVRVGSYRRTENRMERNFVRAENYLSLIGFIVLILGGLGVWSVTRVFVQQRFRTVAVLKCLGATTGRILAIYVLQVAVLGMGGALLGVGIAGLLFSVAPEDIVQQANAVVGIAEVPLALTGSAVGQGIAVGVLVSILFALVPLLDIRQIRPLLLLRDGQKGRAVRFDWVRIAVICAAGGGLIGVATWQAASLEVGFYVVGGFVLVAASLHFVGRVLVAAIRPLTIVRSFALRHAVLNLISPGNQTRVVLLAVGLGSFFLIGVRAVQENLLTTFEMEFGTDMPDMFLIDIQQDQVDGVRSRLQRSRTDDEGHGAPELIPVLRARVVGVNGEDTKIEGVSAVRRAGFGREYTVTYRETLEDNERVIAGRFWDPVASAIPEVSIEESLYERGIRLNDKVRFDVLGREIEAVVTSVRSIEWDDTRSGGFMFLFRPGALDDAPHTYVAFFRGPMEIERRGRLQRDIVTDYPNVSVIDGLEVIQTIRRVLSYVTNAITIVGGIALLAGGLILVGSVAMTKYQRLFQAAVFQTLGANSRAILSMCLIEYGLLGGIAGAVGAVGALFLTWIMSRQLLDIPWEPLPLVSVVGVGLTALLVAIVGVVASADVLRRKPLGTLRAE